MKYLFFLFSTMFTINLLAQSYTAPSFEEVDPIWIHEVRGDDLPDSITSYTHEEYAIPEGGRLLKHDGFIYLLHNIWDRNPYEGILLEKIDMVTGGQVWEYAQFEPIKGESILGINPYISDDQIRVPIYQETGDIWSVFNRGVAGEMFFDMDSGILTQERLTDKEDLLNQEFRVPNFVFGIPDLNSSRLYTDEGNEYYYIENFLEEDSNGISMVFEQFELDSTGHVLSEKQMKNIIDPETYSITTYEMQNGMFLSKYSELNGIDNEGNDILNYKFQVIDKDLNILSNHLLVDGSYRGIITIEPHLFMPMKAIELESEEQWEQLGLTLCASF